MIATGRRRHTVQRCVELAFEHVGLDWQRYVVIDDALKRPAEVDLLVGDASKAKRELGWEPRTSFEELIAADGRRGPRAARPVTSSFWHGRRVLVTGHTGFKGAWLTLWLHALGAEVTGFSGPPPSEPSLFETARVGELVDDRARGRAGPRRGGGRRAAGAA